MKSSIQDLDQRLTQFGIHTEKMTNKDIQAQIVKMYGKIEKKLRQNIIMGRENDDIELQIRTIQEIFQKSSKIKEIDTDFKVLKNQEIKACIDADLEQQKNKNSRVQEDKENMDRQIENTAINMLENSSWTLNGKSNDIERKTKSHVKPSLQQKIEILFCQNQHILQRLEQIEEKLEQEKIYKRKIIEGQRNQIDKISCPFSNFGATLKARSQNTQKTKRIIYKESSKF